MTVFRIGYAFLFRLLALVLLSMLLMVQPACAEPNEYQVKAAMIYNMIRFIDWPEVALQSTDRQLMICVAGTGQLASAVDILQGKEVKGKTITINQVSPANDASGCHVLVLSDLNQYATNSLVKRTRSNGVLTIADSFDFANSGGVIGFVLQEGKVRFEINQTSALRHRIRISSQLLKLARIVQETP